MGCCQFTVAAQTRCCQRSCSNFCSVACCATPPLPSSFIQYSLCFCRVYFTFSTGNTQYLMWSKESISPAQKQKQTKRKTLPKSHTWEINCIMEASLVFLAVHFTRTLCILCFLFRLQAAFHEHRSHQCDLRAVGVSEICVFISAATSLCERRSPAANAGNFHSKAGN